METYVDYDIIPQIKKDFEDYFTAANGYEFDLIEVIIGDKPDQGKIDQLIQGSVGILSIGFSNNRPVEYNTLNRYKSQRRVTCEVIGFTLHQLDIYKFARFARKFIISDDLLSSFDDVEIVIPEDDAGTSYGYNTINEQINMSIFNFVFYIDFTEDLS